MNMPKILLLVTMVFASFSISIPASAAKIYLWYTTEDGKRVPNYGENPPMGVNATLVSDEPSAPTSAPTSPSPESSSDSKLSAEQEAMKAKRKEDCLFEKNRLATLKSSGSRIRMEQADGSSRYLSPNEIAAEIKQSEDFIKQACSF